MLMLALVPVLAVVLVASSGTGAGCCVLVADAGCCVLVAEADAGAGCCVLVAEADSTAGGCLC